jgi:hypothetical protein
VNEIFCQFDRLLLLVATVSLPLFGLLLLRLLPFDAKEVCDDPPSISIMPINRSSMGSPNNLPP